MDKGILKALWAGMYIVCAVLGFISDPEGFSYGMLLFCALAFFVPPALLLYQAKKDGSRKDILLVRTLSLLSLGVTLLALVANFLTVWSDSLVLGDAMYYVLYFVSVPMVCSQNWVVSLFLWACLLMSSLSLSRKKRK